MCWRLQCVRRRGVHTLTCCTHIFLRRARSLRISHIFMRVTHTHGSSVMKKGVCHMSVFVLYFAFSSLMFHPSLLFLYIHFDITFQSTILLYFPVQKAQDTRNAAFASRSLATWPSQMQTQVMSPPSSTRIIPWMMTRCSSTTRTTISPTSRKPRARTLDNSVFPQCLNPLFRTFLMMILLFK